MQTNRNHIDARQRWSFPAQADEEALQLSGRAFDFNCDAVGVIADEAGEAFFAGQTVDKGAESDALHNSADHGSLTDFLFRRKQVHTLFHRTMEQGFIAKSYTIGAYDAWPGPSNA